jgi:superoxide dismutase
MAYKLPPLRFGYDALEPYIDAERWSSITTSTTKRTSIS